MAPLVVPLLRLASDQRLAEQISAGSAHAFEALYDRHHRPVLAFCRHMLGSLDEAEDVLQHTFEAAYRDLRRSGAPPAVRPWLFVIARNRCISLLRARRELPAASIPERVTDRLATDVAAREELRAVFAGLARLPEDQRAALVLSELGDVTHDEIARILDCRREQVKAYVFQARSALVADRAARDTPCAEIREQLSTARGAQLRRTSLRRHLDDCAGCREFRQALHRQRRQLRALLPVAPALGLKRAVLGAVVASGGGGGGGATLGGVAATALIAIAIPAGTVAVARGEEAPAAPATPLVGGGPGGRFAAGAERQSAGAAGVATTRGEAVIAGGSETAPGRTSAGEALAGVGGETGPGGLPPGEAVVDGGAETAPGGTPSGGEPSRVVRPGAAVPSPPDQSPTVADEPSPGAGRPRPNAPDPGGAHPAGPPGRPATAGRARGSAPGAPSRRVPAPSGRAPGRGRGSTRHAPSHRAAAPSGRVPGRTQPPRNAWPSGRSRGAIPQNAGGKARPATPHRAAPISDARATSPRAASPDAGGDPQGTTPRATTPATQDRAPAPASGASGQGPTTATAAPGQGTAAPDRRPDETPGASAPTSGPAGGFPPPTAQGSRAEGSSRDAR